MQLSQAHDRFVDEFAFPVERETVLDQIGAVEIEGPTRHPDTVADALSRTGEESFESAEDLYEVLVCSVGHEYVGRRFYDDRGSNAGIDFEEVSF